MVSPRQRLLWAPNPQSSSGAAESARRVPASGPIARGGAGRGAGLLKSPARALPGARWARRQPCAGSRCSALWAWVSVPPRCRAVAPGASWTGRAPPRAAAAPAPRVRRGPEGCGTARSGVPGAQLWVGARGTRPGRFCGREEEEEQDGARTHALEPGRGGRAGGTRGVSFAAQGRRSAPDGTARVFKPSSTAETPSAAPANTMCARRDRRLSLEVSWGGAEIVGSEGVVGLGSCTP